MATNSGGWLYETNGTPVDKATADNAQARVLEIKADASAAKSDAASALSTANSYAGQIAQANTTAGSALTTAGSALTTAQGAVDTAESAADRVDALEVMGGVQPGSVNDAEMKLHAEQDGGLFNTALKAQIAEQSVEVLDEARAITASVEATKASALDAALATQVTSPVTPAVRFTGTSAYISAPGAAFNVTRDLDVRALIHMEDWTPNPVSGTTMTLVSRGLDAGASQFKFEINNLGGLIFRWSPTGSAAFTAKSSLALLDKTPARATMWVRAAFDADNGSGESEIHFYTSSDGVNWVQLGPSVKTSGAVDFVESSDPLQIGAYAAAAVQPFTGRIFEVSVHDGIDGPSLGHWKAGALPYTDEQGNTWSLTGTGTSLDHMPASTLSVLPEPAWNEWQANATSYANNLTEWGGYQFAAYWGADRYGRIARRALGSKAWDIFSLQNITGLLAAQVANDGHNTLAIAADKDGFLHVAGNMHGDWIKYMRSTAPGGYMGWEYPGMIRGTGAKTGTDEGLVTYPRFFTNPVTGDLYFMYRNGASGNGNTYLNRYNTTTKTWARVAWLLDGESTGESAYENNPVFDENGTLHLSYTWAAGGSGFNDREDLCYMRSTNGGTTWTTITGTAVPLPVTHPNAPVILPAGTGDGMLNQTGMAVDGQGRPHIAHFWAPDGDRNIWHLYQDGPVWRHERVTDLANVGLDWTGMSRPAIIHYAGRLLVIWRHQYEGWGGKVWATDVTLPGRKRHYTLLDADLREWEPAPDYAAVRRGSLNLLATRVNAQVPAAIPGYEAANWARQPAGVLTVDLARFDQRTRHQVPKNKPTDP